MALTGETSKENERTGEDFTHISDEAFRAQGTLRALHSLSGITQQRNLLRAFVTPISECEDVEIMAWFESRELLADMCQIYVSHRTIGGKSVRRND